MIKKINFSKYQEVKTSYWQYDYGQKIEIVLSHPIANLTMQWGKNNTEIVQQTIIDENNQTTIPDDLLSGSENFSGYLCITEENFGMTLHELKVIIKRRVGPNEKITAD